MRAFLQSEPGKLVRERGQVKLRERTEKAERTERCNSAFRRISFSSTPAIAVSWPA